MISGHRNANFVIAEVERKFSAAKKLLVLPAGDIRVGTCSGEPLGHFIDVISIFFKKLISGSPAYHF